MGCEFLFSLFLVFLFCVALWCERLISHSISMCERVVDGGQEGRGGGGEGGKITCVCLCVVCVGA